MRVAWAAATVRLATTQGRMTLPFHVPSYATPYVSGQVATADLIRRDGAWWLHIVVGVDAPTVAPSEAVVGVDLGLAQPAATSTNRFLGQQRWRATEGRYFRLRRALQQKGTRSARRHLRHLRGKQRRFRRDCDHVLAKQVVQATPPGGTLVLESLTGIRARTQARTGRQRRRLHGWSFAQLQSFIRYKAAERGCTVVAVDPRHTSMRCSVCGHTARTNRRSRAWFHCRACGYQTHADRNAARNIVARYRASRSMPAAGGQPVNLPTVSGAHASGPPRHKLSPRGDSR
jgi:IS605 OrfB family transposase